MFIVQCSTVNCHLKEVPEPKLCLERCPELVVDRIILAVRQPQSQERGVRGHDSSTNRVDSRSVDQVCTVINDVVKVKEVKHFRGKLDQLVFAERKGLKQTQVNFLERAIAVCITLP